MSLPRAPLKAILLLLCAVLFVAVGVWMILDGEPFGWIAAGFFALGIPAALAMLLGEAPVQLDREGFELRTVFKRRRYFWVKLSEFGLAQVGSTRFIVFDDSSKQRRVLDRINRGLVGGTESLPASLIGGRLEDACALLNAFRERALAESARK